jgi:hypothetical protein
MATDACGVTPRPGFGVPLTSVCLAVGDCHVSGRDSGAARPAAHERCAGANRGIRCGGQLNHPPSAGKPVRYRRCRATVSGEQPTTWPLGRSSREGGRAVAIREPGDPSGGFCGYPSARSRRETSPRSPSSRAAGRTGGLFRAIRHRDQRATGRHHPRCTRGGARIAGSRHRVPRLSGRSAGRRRRHRYERRADRGLHPRDRGREVRPQHARLLRRHECLPIPHGQLNH